MHTAVQLPLGVQLQENLSFDSFYTGPNGDLLVQLEESLLARKGKGSVLLWGQHGLGKTHLLQALCREAGQTGQSSAYLPIHELLSTGPEIIQGMHTQDLICIDDVDLTAGRRGWEQALVALFDACRSGDAFMVLSSSRHPDQLPLTLKDLHSRLNWGPVYRLLPLSDDHKIRLIQQRCRARGLNCPPEVARYLLNRNQRDVPRLLEIIEQLDRASLAAKRRLTVPFVREVLGAG